MWLRWWNTVPQHYNHLAEVCRRRRGGRGQCVCVGGVFWENRKFCGCVIARTRRQVSFMHQFGWLFFMLLARRRSPSAQFGVNFVERTLPSEEAMRTYVSPCRSRCALSVREHRTVVLLCDSCDYNFTLHAFLLFFKAFDLARCFLFSRPVGVDLYGYVSKYTHTLSQVRGIHRPTLSFGGASFIPCWFGRSFDFTDLHILPGTTTAVFLLWLLGVSNIITTLSILAQNVRMV